MINTRARLSPPLLPRTSLLWASLSRCQWKRLIQKSEREFEEAHGHPPLLADKEVGRRCCWSKHVPRNVQQCGTERVETIQTFFIPPRLSCILSLPVFVLQANSEWYGCYKKLRSALASLPAAGPVDGENDVSILREGAVGVRRDYDPSLSLTPAASESLVTLIRATEHLLAAKETAPGAGAGGFDVIAAEACRKVRV